MVRSQRGDTGVRVEVKGVEGGGGLAFKLRIRGAKTADRCATRLLSQASPLYER